MDHQFLIKEIGYKAGRQIVHLTLYTYSIKKEASSQNKATMIVPCFERKRMLIYFRLVHILLLQLKLKDPAGQRLVCLPEVFLMK